jgi:hypothetical protein
MAETPAAGAAAAGTPAAATPAAGNDDDLRRDFRELLSSVKDLKPSDREERLMHENFTIRDRARRYRQERDDAKKGLPAAGAVVLTGDDATAYAAIQKTGVPLKDIPARVTERDTLLTEQQQRAASTLHETVAESLELNPRAFAMFMRARDLVLSYKRVEMRDEDGKIVTEEVPVIRAKGAAEDTARPLLDALEQEYKADLELLSVGVERGAGEDTASTRREDARDTGSEKDNGVPFPRTRREAPSGAAARARAVKEAETRKAATGRYRL